MQAQATTAGAGGSGKGPKSTVIFKKNLSLYLCLVGMVEKGQKGQKGSFNRFLMASKMGPFTKLQNFFCLNMYSTGIVLEHSLKISALLIVSKC